MFPSSDQDYKKLKKRLDKLKRIPEANTVKFLYDVQSQLQKKIDFPDIVRDEIPEVELADNMKNHFVNLHKSSLSKIFKLVLSSI